MKTEYVIIFDFYIKSFRKVGDLSLSFVIDKNSFLAL